MVLLPSCISVATCPCTYLKLNRISCQSKLTRSCEQALFESVIRAALRLDQKESLIGLMNIR
ncbi:hypothetical protein K461DRAFT_280560 [Myriangium duriaei CBS 260.36]|uniref:Uncharacterized protein n=1 Tax=Myriangium duriaei CBS 260.36 TaxID=1168546 RepID=A0A9P4IXU5_9PEZI|nr:hypothetical protein K461DRAFT_280560 [Myriangium duriaei CBS 260.36]